MTLSNYPSVSLPCVFSTQVKLVQLSVSCADEKLHASQVERLDRRRVPVVVTNWLASIVDDTLTDSTHIYRENFFHVLREKVNFTVAATRDYVVFRYEQVVNRSLMNGFVLLKALFASISPLVNDTVLSSGKSASIRAESDG